MSAVPEKGESRHCAGQRDQPRGQIRAPGRELNLNQLHANVIGQRGEELAHQLSLDNQPGSTTLREDGV
jgi:hypothetical protein